MSIFKPQGISPARYTAVMGMLAGISAVLTFLEGIFSAFLPAGIRIGLSNIVIMSAILCLNLPSAFLLIVFKAAFVFITRGTVAAIMSLSGGVAAFIVLALLFRKTLSSYILTSVCGALAHSLGQLAAARIIIGNSAVFGYAPILGICSFAAGICTGIVLKAVFPQIRCIIPKKEE